jgi:2-polyprenyl-3-methyl-5-hydroxy-6-metoxy-1,4-benzoquinol methylase
VARAVLSDSYKVIDNLDAAPGMRVLDIGSGAGNMARLAAEIVGPAGHVTAVDADAAAVEIASTYNTVPTVEFRVADAHTLDGIDDGFDAVTGRLVLMYLSNPAAALQEAGSRQKGWPAGTSVRMIRMHARILDLHLDQAPGRERGLPDDRDADRL